MSARLRAEFLRPRDEGTRLAGRLTDVPHRPAVYHQIYVDSGRNHVFRLIAAHGALWSRGYFTFGLGLFALSCADRTSRKIQQSTAAGQKKSGAAAEKKGGTGGAISFLLPSGNARFSWGERRVRRSKPYSVR